MSATAAALIERLRAVLPNESLVTDPASLDAYRIDRAADPKAVPPLAVVRAEATEHVQAAVRIAAELRVPIVPRGAGSGLSGGSASSDPALVISLERMRDISVDPVTRMATVQPGALNAEVKQAAAQHGLWYPPDPSSFEFCSIGGNIATNAGGLCCVKYGVTSDYVLGLTVVLADGTVVRLGGPRLKDVAGLSLTKLFVGSEGTLGIVTEATLRLIPAQAPPTTVVAVFSELSQATDAVLEISRMTRPSMLEFMDRASIHAVERELRMGLDLEAAAMLVVQLDDGQGESLTEVERICTGLGATECYATVDAEEGEAFVVARREVIPAVEKLGHLLLEDVGVPVPRLGELAGGIERIAAEHGLTIALIAHAGDGNTHPLIVVDPTDADQVARGERAYGAIMDLAISLGGTITGEHGVGRLKRPWLKPYLGNDVYELNLRIKRALDPDNLMNPGAVFSGGVGWAE